MRRALTAAPLLLALFVSGCVGTTTFATGVGRTEATLNGTGTTGPSGTDVYFEYWPTANAAAKVETSHRAIGPNVSGPIREHVGDLADDTRYSFRLCGVEDARVVCAQTRQFETGHANVQAWGETERATFWFQRIDVDVVSGPGGEDPSGHATNVGRLANQAPLLWGSKSPNVTCLHVEGNTAVVGFTNPGETGENHQSFALLQDNGASGSGKDEFLSFPNGFFHRQPDDCSLPLQGAPGAPVPLAQGDIAISDASVQTPR
jgi:hypothetical protein